MAPFFSLCLKSIMALGLVVTAALPLAAQDLNPLGIWEPDNRESRYEFTVCGERNDRLCAELIWIQEDKKDARNTKYLNTYMFENARQTSPGRWRGTVKLEGFNIGGTVIQTTNDTMNLDACVMFVFCENIRLNRVQ